MGIPVSVSQDFRDLRKYLDFRQERKTPLNPQANAEAEQFMSVLTKLYQIRKLAGSNFKQEIYRLFQSDTSLHCTAKVAPTDLVYSGRKFRTWIPIGETPYEHNFEKLFQRDLEKKMQIKGYAGNEV